MAAAAMSASTVAMAALSRVARPTLKKALNELPNTLRAAPRQVGVRFKTAMSAVQHGGPQSEGATNVPVDTSKQQQQQQQQGRGGGDVVPERRRERDLTTAGALTDLFMDPFGVGGIDRTIRSMNRLMRDLERNFGFPSVTQALDEDTSSALMLAQVPVDVIEDKDKYLFKVDVPGVDKSSITVQVQDNVMTVAGVRRKEEVDEGANYRRVERSVGQFMRSFRLPKDTDPNNIKASAEHGVLTINVPKRAEAQKDSIQVKVE